MNPDATTWDAEPRRLEDEYPELGVALKAIANKTDSVIRGLIMRTGQPTIVLLKGGGATQVGKMTERNDPCPCGSGKKFKKCCLNRE